MRGREKGGGRWRRGEREALEDWQGGGCKYAAGLVMEGCWCTDGLEEFVNVATCPDPVLDLRSDATQLCSAHWGTTAKL